MSAPQPLRPWVPVEHPADEARRTGLLAAREAARGVVSRVAGPARMLPGVAAAGCGFAGAWLVWSLGVALLVAAGLLLLVDARIPGPSA